MDNIDDRLLASAARFLIDGQEEDAANVLLSCSLSIVDSGDTWWVGDETHYATHVELVGPRMAYDILINDNNEISKAIKTAIKAVMPGDRYIKHFTVKAEHIDIDNNWRVELLEIARGKGVHNQGIGSGAIRVWQNLRFRSESECQIARSLDKANVLFLANCKVRLGSRGNRQNKEADFLVCLDGKWGILEVDGEPFHPPTRTVQDHERDRLFREHGIIVVEHFDASECFQNPDKVVEKFLHILKKA